MLNLKWHITKTEIEDFLSKTEKTTKNSGRKQKQIGYYVELDKSLC